jgi:DNA-binding transcriptional regulator YhcF (GntR family)
MQLMNATNIYTLIELDEYSVTPKYQQLTNCLVRAVQQGSLQEGYVLPSINDLSYELDLSRRTVEHAYACLKKKGIVRSIPGKGYFINGADVKGVKKVFLLFNKLSAHKKIIYDAFAETLGDEAAIDFYIYSNNFGLFKKLLQNRKEDYDHYVIIPHFLEGSEHAADLINELPTGKLILLDKQISGIKGGYGAVYENFERDIYHALRHALPHLTKYHTLKIVFPLFTYYPEEILDGFRTFCQEFAFDYKVVHLLVEEAVGAGELYINLMEDDLVTLVQKIKESSLQVGTDVGIISYNETPWKQFILDGIATMSTDFKMMGVLAAQMILGGQPKHQEVPFSLIARQSL